MGGELAIWIEPHLARAEQQARLADVVDGLLLLGRKLATDPDEFTLARELARQAVLVEIREDLGQLPRRANRVDHHLRLRIKGMRGEVGGKDSAVPVGDIRATRDD